VVNRELNSLRHHQTLLKLGTYQALDLTIAQALARRPSDFEGVLTCGPESSLASIFSLIRMRRIHRLVVVDDGKPKAGESAEDSKDRKGRFLGMVSLSDILRHVIVSICRPQVAVGNLSSFSSIGIRY
jgi:5'-AMP-activated protein kinase regulatory gamma subunit